MIVVAWFGFIGRWITGFRKASFIGHIIRTNCKWIQESGFAFAQDQEVRAIFKRNKRQKIEGGYPPCLMPKLLKFHHIHLILWQKPDVKKRIDFANNPAFLYLLSFDYSLFQRKVFIHLDSVWSYIIFTKHKVSLLQRWKKIVSTHVENLIFGANTNAILNDLRHVIWPSWISTKNTRSRFFYYFL